MIGKRISVIAVHPDDETLGAGATILKLKEENAHVSWVIVTRMGEKYSEEQHSIRIDEIQAVSNRYSFDKVYELEFDAGGLNSLNFPELVSKLSATFDDFQSDTIIIPSELDPHSDHYWTNKAALSASKSFRKPFLKSIFEMEVLSETNYGLKGSFEPNYYVDVSKYFDKKIEIMKEYKSEMKPHPFPRSKDALLAQGLLRGSECNSRFAESFRLLKYIE